MAHRIQLIVAVTGTLLFAGACGISVTGISSGAELDASAPAGDAGTTSDAVAPGVDGDAPAAPADCSKPTCDRLGLAAGGFTQVLFGDAADPCPNGFDTLEAIEDPEAENGSCACEACVTTGSSCTSGDVQSKYSDDGSCSKNGDSNDLESGVCVPSPGVSWAGNFASEIPPDPELGDCAAAGVGVRAKVKAKARRVCMRRPDTCAQAVCAAPWSLDVCLMIDGEHDCPAGAPDRFTIGGDVSMVCAACDCEPTAECGGTMSWWKSSNQCAGAPTGTVPGNACVAVTKGSIGSYRWDGFVASQGCKNVQPVPKATIALTGERTVCCPKR